MGGGDSKQVILNNFRPDQWSQISVPSKFKRTLLVNNHDKNLFLQKNVFEIANRDHYGLARQLYELRYHSKSLIQNQYITIEDVDSACSKSQVGYLYTQRIDIRLSQIYNIPYPDILHVYYQCLQGYEQLFHKVGYFRIDDDCIGINEFLIAKVWHSSNFAQIIPSFPLRNEEQMIQTIINIIQAHTDIRTMPHRQPSFGNFLYRHQGQRIGFNEAKRYLRQYSYLYNNGVIPDHLGHLQYDDPYLRKNPVGSYQQPFVQAPYPNQQGYNFLSNVVQYYRSNYQERRPRRVNHNLHPTINSQIRRPPSQTTHTVFQPVSTTITPVAQTRHPVVSHHPVIRPPVSTISSRPIASITPIAPVVRTRPSIVGQRPINFTFLPDSSVVRPVVPTEGHYNLPNINFARSQTGPLNLGSPKSQSPQNQPISNKNEIPNKQSFNQPIVNQSIQPQNLNAPQIQNSNKPLVQSTQYATKYSQNQNINKTNTEPYKYETKFTPQIQNTQPQNRNTALYYQSQRVPLNQANIYRNSDNTNVNPLNQAQPQISFRNEYLKLDDTTKTDGKVTTGGVQFKSSYK